MIESWRVLKVGACRHPEFMARRGGHLCPVEFPALVGLIRHSEMGWLLFDTGYHQRFFVATEPFPERLYRLATPVQYGEDDSLVGQLAAMNIAPEDIAAVFVSHFHGDHVAGLAEFTKARILCGRAGFEQLLQGSRFSRVRKGLLSALVPDDAGARADFLEDRPLVDLPPVIAPFGQGVDLAGDGSLFAVPLPGHCPGHWGLLVRADRDVLFIGDAAWSIGAVVDNMPPPAFTTGLLGDTAVYRGTLDKLHRLQAAGTVEIIPSHCQVTAARLL